jgi:hypothetical protein
MHDPLHREIARLADGIAALRVVYGLIRTRGHRMTPAEIIKLTEQASRAKVLMSRSSSTGERAKTVFDNYEKTLTAFESNVDSRLEGGRRPCRHDGRNGQRGPGAPGARATPYMTSRTECTANHTKL